MENWDEKKLEEVVNKKHGEAEKKKAKTQIVSVFFNKKTPKHSVKLKSSNETVPLHLLASKHTVISPVCFFAGV